MKNILLLLLLFSCRFSYGQGREELKRLIDTYMGKENIAFEIAYRCYKGGGEGAAIDSMSGSCIMGGGAYWYQLEDTEMMQDSAYALALFKADNILYVSKKRHAGTPAHSLPLLDSALAGQLDTVTLVKGKSQKELVLTFRDTVSYKQMRLFIDNKTGLLHRALIKVSAKLLYDPEVSELVTGTGADALIEVRYSGYRQAVNLDRLRSAHYLRQGKDGPEPTPAYQQYKIFIGSLAP